MTLSRFSTTVSSFTFCLPNFNQRIINYSTQIRAQSTCPNVQSDSKYFYFAARVKLSSLLSGMSVLGLKLKNFNYSDSYISHIPPAWLLHSSTTSNSALVLLFSSAGFSYFSLFEDLLPRILDTMEQCTSLLSTECQDHINVLPFLRIHRKTFCFLRSWYGYDHPCYVA